MTDHEQQKKYNDYNAIKIALLMCMATLKKPIKLTIHVFINANKAIELKFV